MARWPNYLMKIMQLVYMQKSRRSFYQVADLLEERET